MTAVGRCGERNPPEAPLGAHLSIAGGLPEAARRAKELGATALQIFTTPPQRWAERPLGPGEAREFRAAVSRCGVRVTVAHDSYLINLATEDLRLHRRSLDAFQAELKRCRLLGIDYLVTHPGNATGGDRAEALERNARALGEALGACPGETVLLLETTAGCGTALGASFEELARLRAQIPAPERDRVAVCLDTAHVFAAGYDLRTEYEAVLERFDRILGLDSLRLLHLNDSRAPLGSRVDRHAEIGRGELGEAPFARLMRDPRLRRVARVIETPKGEEGAVADRRNLERLRRLARE
ncbi:MAG: deoxyribonuclease IV [Gemmatimonadota bacterium]